MDLFTSSGSKLYNRGEYVPKVSKAVQVLACLILFFSISFTVKAQNNEISVNVQVLPPYSNNIYDYIGADKKISRSFQEQIIVTLRNNNPNRSYEVKLIAKMQGDNGVEASMNPNFQPFQRIILPAGEMKIISGKDLAEINRNLSENDINAQGINAKQIRRTGTLPEGTYNVCFTAVDYRTGEALSATDPFGCSAPIHISFPDPPVIAYPYDEAVILAMNPQSFNISWAPVQMTMPRIRYRIKIVELTNINANPYDLMEQTNVAYYREDNLMTTSIFYGQGKPPLTVGNSYAMRVQAYDPLGEINFKNNGYSEINTFRYANSYDDGSGLSDMDFVNLVPGYVKLIELDKMDYTQTAGVERFSGRAKIAFTNPLTETQDVVSVLVTNLSLNTGNRQNPTFLGGEVKGSLSSFPELMRNLEGFITPSNISWDYEDGLTLTGDVTLGDKSKVSVAGEVQITPVGAIGQLRAGGQQNPIYEINEEEVRLKITEIIASVPENTIKGHGFLEFLDQENEAIQTEPCVISDINLLKDKLAINVSCTLDKSIALAQNSDKLMLRFLAVDGVIMADWTAASLDYDVQLHGVLDLKTDGDTYNCGINIGLNLATERDPEVTVLGSNCTLDDRKLELGFVQVDLRNIVLNRMSYKENKWDFELAMDGNFILPAFDNWRSPEVNNIVLNKQGITIAEQDWSSDALQGLQKLGWDESVSLSPQQIHFDAITYPWFETIENQGPWNMTTSGTAAIQNLPIIPCLGEYNYDFSLGYNSTKGLFGELNGEGEGCSWDFSRESSLTVTQMKGELFTEIENNRRIKKSSLELTGKLISQFLTECEGEQSFDNVFLKVDKDFVRGSINQFTPNCPFKIGPFDAKITNSVLSFDVKNGEQQVLLDANANLILSDGTKVEGTFLYDLVNGKFLNIEFELDNPFTWNIPEEEPVMSFYIKEAIINQNGFLIDGRNTLKLPGGKDINATFDNLMLDINSMKIENGQVIFDESFAFEAGIDTVDYSLKYKAVEVGQSLTLNPALYFSMGANVKLDSSGLKTGGNAGAKLIFGDQNITDDLSVNFSEDFTIGLYPFKVSLGRADLMVQEQMIAYINDQGLNINPLDFALNALPDRIPLPDNEVAYLMIRDISGKLLINVEKLSNGNIKIESLPGKDLQFYLPALDAANPPMFGNVQLDDVQLNADITNPSIASGTITIDVPENTSALTDLNLPIKIKQIAFGTNLFGSMTQGLYLAGNLSLFQTTLPAAGTVSMQVDHNGLATASFNLTGQDLSIPLIPNSDMVTYKLHSLSGGFSGYLNNLSTQNFALDLSGQFAVQNTETLIATADLDLHLEPGSFRVTKFESSLEDNPIDLDFGSFGLLIKEITALPEFNYTDANGFDFAAQLDLELYLNLAGGERFEFPLNGFEIRNTGLHIPAQNINPSSIPGFSTPSINIGGFEIELLALRTSDPIVFHWSDRSNWNFNPSLDLSIRMPELAAKGLNIPDGLSFYDVSIQNGIFSGTMAPFEPPSGIDIKLGNFPDAPTLNIGKIIGELLAGSDGSQDFNFDLNGKLEDLSGFQSVDLETCASPEFSLSIIGGVGFEGTVSNFTPCGNLAIGPFKLTPLNSELLFAFQNDVQEVSLDGSVRLDLADSPSASGLADGNLKLNLLNGSLMDGYIEINQSFPFAYPAGNPLLDFTLNEARLDTTGFTMQGTGSIDVGNVQNTVIFNALKLSLDDLSIISGSANLGSELNLDLNLNPFGISLAKFDAERPTNDHLRMSLDSDIELNKYGINYAGTSVASVRFGGEDYPDLRAEFEDDFAFNIRNLTVTKGRAEFYVDENGQLAQDPLAILDENGFNIGGGVVALLPDTLGLPSNDVAYIVLKDQDGNSLINATHNDSNGWDISTKSGQPLTLVIPSLANGKTAPQAQISFSLTTDSNYNPTGGTITLESEIDLEPNFELPLALTELSLIADSRTEISTTINVNLPESISSEPVTSSFVINSNGFKKASLEWGTYTQSYDSTIVPAFTQSIDGTLPSDSKSSNVAIHLYGLKAELGVNKSLQLSGGLESDILAKENETPKPIFFYADYSNQSWTGGVDASYLTDGIAVGKLTLKPDPEQPFILEISAKKFVLKADGIIDFKALVGEELEVAIQGLEVGVDYSQSKPKPIFAFGAGSTTLADYDVELFDGEVVLGLQSPTFKITGREIGITSNGDIQVFDENVGFTGLKLNSTTGLTLDKVTFSTDYNIIPGYAKLKSLALGQKQEKLTLTAEVSITLPEPIKATASAKISIFRESNNQIEVAIEGPEFDLNRKYEIKDVAAFQLDKVLVDIKPSNMSQSGIYANGKLLINDVPRVDFGSAGDIQNNYGIGYTNGVLRYNATGNAAWEFEEGFFKILVNANMAVSDANSFMVELGGAASVDISGVVSSLNYEGFKINSTGIANRGNLSGSGSLTLMNFASLTIGKFQYEVPRSGESTVTVQLPISNDNPESFESKDDTSVQFVSTEVKRFVRFGGSSGTALNLTLGGSNPDESGSGGFGGGVDEVMFYELPNGDKHLKIDNANLSIGRTMTASAYLEYTEENGGFILRATAAAEVGIGTTTAKAALAGYFANMNDELKFGLFVGVEASTGIPLFPGVITLTGGGAGYFYKPAQADLDLITKRGGPLMSLGHKMVRDELENSFNPPPVSNLNFSVMLFAKVGILGTEGQYALQGSTFIQISDKSVYLDAYGTVLGLDGNGATKLKLQGGAYVQSSFDNFFIDGGGYVDLQIPVVLDGRMELVFFFANNPANNNEVIWAIDGGLKVEVFSKLNMTGSIIACPSGLYMDAGVGVKFGKYGFSVDAQFMGSVWYANDASFKYPFGAYLKAGVELCFMGACAHPTAKAAFATLRNGGFELVVGAQACIYIPIYGDACAHAMASMKSASGFNVDVGTGKMKSSLFDEAEGMRSRFEEIVDKLRDEINATKDAVNNFTPEIPPLEIPTEVLTSAGYLFHTNPWGRAIGTMATISNIKKIVNPIPSNLQWVVDNVMIGGDNSNFPVERVTTYGSEYDNVLSQKQKMKNAMDSSTLFLEDALIRMTSIRGTAYNFREEAEDTFEEMITAMESSPVTSTNLTIQQNSEGEITQSPSFIVDESKASAQNEKSGEAKGFTDKMRVEFERAIVATEKNLGTLDSLLAMRLEKNTSPSTGNSSNTNNNTTSNTNSGGIGQMIAHTNYVAEVNPYIAYNTFPLISFYPSISDVTANLRDAIESIEQYYAYEGSFRARQHAWMQFAHTELVARENNVKGGLSSAANASSSKSDSFLKQNMDERIKILYALSSASAQDGLDKMNNTQLSDQNFKISLENLWYDMHVLGLEEAKRDIAFDVIKSLREQRDEALSLINEPYANLSEEINSAYVLKSEILTLLHGLYQQYDKVISAADSTGVEAELEDLQQEISTRITGIENALIPPTINNIVVFSQNEFFRNKARITWSSSSTPIETSFQVQQFGDNTIATGFGQGNYKSLGGKDKLYLHSFKDAFPRVSNPQTDAMYETKNFSVGFRLRSSGGITSVRRANFNVAVGKNSSEPTVSWTNVKETDNTAPEIVYMAFVPDTKPYANTSGSATYSKSVNGTVNKNHYTAEQQSQTFQVGARDDESDVVKFEFAVGTAEGLLDVQDWSLLTGKRIRYPRNNYGDYNGPDEYLLTEVIGKVNSLSLQTGKQYFFSVRVTNGEGLETIRSMKIPLAYDGTPPSKPSPQYTMAMMPMYAIFNFNPVRVKPLATVTPDYKHLTSRLVEMLDRLENNPNKPKIEFKWSASNDPESGILGYEYYVSKDSMVNKDKFVGRVTTELTSKTLQASGNENMGEPRHDVPLIAKYSGSVVKDFRSHYLFVRSINHASNVSDIAKIGPFRASDPTAPDVPDMQVTNQSNALRIHMIENSFDPESGLKGYQYAIGTSATSLDIQDFQTGGKVDWEFSNYDALFKGVTFSGFGGSSSSPTQPTFDIDKSNLPQGQPIYIFLRAVNHQGMNSGTVACGPIVLDNTPPETPNIDLSTIGQDKLKITIGNIKDGESGVTKVVYRMFWKENGVDKNTPHKTFYQTSNPNKGVAIGTKTNDIGNYDSGSVRVVVWVYNAAGKMTTATKSLPPQYQYFNNTTTMYPQTNFQFNAIW